MKKFLFLATALLVMASQAATAQKVSTAKELAKLDKADATLVDVKKNTKAATWNAHGKAYTDAYMLPTKELLRDTPVMTLQMNVGQPDSMTEGMFLGTPVVIAGYEYVDVFVDPQSYLIVGWEQKKSIKDNLAETAIESYKKAYELDPKLGSKIAANAMTLANALAQQGDVLNLINKTAEAAYSFELAYRAQQVCPEAQANPANLYNSGLLYTIHASSLKGEQAVAVFAKSQAILSEALAAGYKDETGNIYYYLFHSYYGQKDTNRDEFLPKAKNALLEGIKLYPKNATILDGLMNLYTAEEGIGDPAELTAMIEESLKADPTNYDLWFGRGRVYNAMKNFDECIKSFKKCSELRPNDYEPFFYTGYFIIEKANVLVEQLNTNAGLSYEDYNKENDKINLVYAEAIPWLEKAFNIKSDDAATIEYLNRLCFRLRDMEGMMDKYNKYHALFEQIR